MIQRELDINPNVPFLFTNPISMPYAGQVDRFLYIAYVLGFWIVFWLYSSVRLHKAFSLRIDYKNDLFPDAPRNGFPAHPLNKPTFKWERAPFETYDY